MRANLKTSKLMEILIKNKDNQKKVRLWRAFYLPPTHVTLDALLEPQCTDTNQPLRLSDPWRAGASPISGAHMLVMPR
jgi:hypothetical protein